MVFALPDELLLTYYVRQMMRGKVANRCKNILGAESGTPASYPALTTFGLARTRYRPGIHKLYNQIETE
jgi:hypothetical protein